MSPDERFLEQLLAALGSAGLEAIVVGTTAAALQGVPIMTRDVDLLVRDTPKNREKIDRVRETLGAAKPIAVSPLSTTVTLLGPPIAVDLLFDGILPGLSFEDVRSRAVRVRVGSHVASVAALEDVIASKEASNRAKDAAQLPILRETLRVQKASRDAGP